MNGAIETGRRGRGRGGKGPKRFGGRHGIMVLFATIFIAVPSWIVAFVGCVFAHLRSNDENRPNNNANPDFPNFVWWTMVFMFFCILGVTVAGLSGRRTFNMAIVGFASAGLVLTSSAVQAFIYTSDPPRLAAAAGHIGLCATSIIWVFLFGWSPEPPPRSYVDSLALSKDHGQSRHSRPMTDGYGPHRPETSVSSHQAPQMYTSAQLNGFETSSPVSGYPGGPAGVDHRSSSQPRFGGGLTSPQPHMQPQPTGHAAGLMAGGGSGSLGSSMGPGGAGGPGMSGSGVGAPLHGDSVAPAEVSAPTEYPYRAKAIYSYDANPEDANEISFSKHEVLEVSDVSGRWWQAKKENGETGIAPSNYLILL
ncbi:MAG: Transmembrane osmosensor [Lichina confinis]|nr:MAG: Transmembrane osmosensor [Lichina confinis]